MGEDKPIQYENHSFTAPAVIPLMRYLARNRYRITMGTAIKMEPAAKRENSVSPRLIRPTATVHVSLVFSSSLGRIKSLQGQVKEVSAVYTIMGMERGIWIFQNTWKLVAPSSRAASSSVLGMESKKPFCTW